MARQLYVLSVLIVDDDPDLAEAMAHLVRRCGHDVQTAYTPAEAVLAVDADPPDVVILDIGIPGQDGYALAKRICDRLTRRPLLVAMTGQDGLAARSRSEGFDEHLRKPADPARIRSLLRARAEELGGAGPAE